MSTTNPNRSRRILLRLGITIAILAALLGGGYYYFFHNYAKDAAQPLEAALIKGGAVKKYDRGDSGRGPDNREPWYEAVLAINASKDDTERLVSKIAQENGYTQLKLTHTTTEGDIFYTDNTSKQSNYPSLNGPIEVGFELDGKADSANHRGIRVHVNLPSYGK